MDHATHAFGLVTPSGIISTTGVGLLDTKHTINGSQAKAGDKVIVSGTIGDHGIAVLEARGDLGFSTNLENAGDTKSFPFKVS